MRSSRSPAKNMVGKSAKVEWESAHKAQDLKLRSTVALKLLPRFGHARFREKVEA